MRQIEFTLFALEQLDRMVELYELPVDARDRVRRSTKHLAHFPESGAPLYGASEPLRFVLGPWTWMLIIYAQLDDRVVIVTIEDSRAESAATSDR